MANYRLGNRAQDDLIIIHHYGMEKFGEKQADKYFNALFDCFEVISERPFSFISVDFIK